MTTESPTDPSNDLPSRTREGKFSTWVAKNGVAMVIVGSFIVCLLIVLVRISVDVNDSPKSPDDRLVQLTQWTIGTVLTIALGLVGLNWLSSSRNAEREEELSRDRYEQIKTQTSAGLQDALDRIGLAEQDLRDRQAQIDELLDLAGTLDARIKETNDLIMTCADDITDLESEAKNLWSSISTQHVYQSRLDLDNDRRLEALMNIATGIISMAPASQGEFPLFAAAVRPVIDRLVKMSPPWELVALNASVRTGFSELERRTIELAIWSLQSAGLDSYAEALSRVYANWSIPN